MKRILLYLIFSISTTITFAQTITTKPLDTVYDGICVGKSMKVYFDKTGEFDASNKFKAQMIFYRYENNSYKEYKLKLDGESPTSPVTVTIPDTLTGFESFQLKIISTAPVVEGTIAPNYVKLYHFLRVQLNSAAINANPNEATPITGKTLTRGAGKIYFNDNSVVNITYYSDFILKKNPSSTTTYSVVKTENSCGVFTPDPAPSTTLNVNPIGFKLINTEVEMPCSGGSVYLTYDSQKAFNADNEFKVVLGYSANHRLSTKQFTIACKKVNENTLSFKLPEFPTDSSITITSLQLSSSSPKAIALNRYTSSYFSINDTPEYSIKTNNIGINWNEEAIIIISKKGEKYNENNVVLNDGRVDLDIEPLYQSNYNEIHYKVKPDVTTNYQIRNKPWGCDVISKPVGTVEVKVNPGVKLVSAPKIICENTKAQIRIEKRGDFNPDNVFSIELLYYDQGQQKIIIPAAIVNDSTAEFSINKEYFSGAVPISYYSTSIKFRSSSPFSVSQASEISLARSPTLRLTENNYSIQEGGGNLWIEKEETGGQPYTYLVNEGSVEYTTAQLSFRPARSTTYTIKQISNQCGTAYYDNLKATATIKKSVNQVVQPYGGTQNIRACVGSKIEVSFVVNGTRDTSDVFHFEIAKIVNNEHVWESWGSSKTSPISFTPPADADSHTYYYRISNPSKKLAWYYYYELKLLRVPKAKLDKGSIPKEILAGGQGQIAYTLSGGGTIITELNDGQKGNIQVEYNGTGHAYFNFPVYTTQTYHLKSIRNECGIGETEGEATLNVKDFRIETLKIGDSGSSDCEGNIIALARAIKGTLPKDARFKVQLSDVSGENFGDIESYQNGNDLYAIVPKGLAESHTLRKFRIITTNYDGFYASTNFVLILTKATAKITGENGESVLNQVNPTANLKVTFTGAGPFNLTLNNPIEGFGPYSYDESFTNYGYAQRNPFIITVKPKTNKDSYFLTSLSNGCGFGSYSGEVKIGSIKPTLGVLQVLTSPYQYICAGKEITIKPVLAGNFNDDNVFKITLREAATNKTFVLLQKISLDSLVKLTVPKDVSTGNYELSLSSSSPVLVANLSYLLASAPTIELSGNTTINSGQKTSLALNGKYGSVYNFTLSDGTTGAIDNQTEYDRTFIQVAPTQTTEYRITSIRNSCGEGIGLGIAKVIVNPATDKKVFIDRIEPAYTLCSGQKIRVEFRGSGNFTINNKFTLQISDENGENFKDLPTTRSGALIAELPTSLKPGLGYRIRVVASDADAGSATSSYMYRLYQGSTAMLLTNSIISSPGQVADVKILLAGMKDVYKYLSFGKDSLSAKIYTAPDSAYTIKVEVKGKEVYKLYRVYDQFCGEGKVLGDKQLVIDIITAQENPEAQFVVYPNPTDNRILIKNLGGLSSKISVTNIAGIQSLLPVEPSEGATEYELDIQHLPAGTYLLIVEQKNKTYVNKIIKL